jgi:hypothetical protein
MKKEYEQPRLEVAEFCFSEHIAASGTSCLSVWTNIGVQSCTSGTPEQVTVNN